MWQWNKTWLWHYITMFCQGHYDWLIDYLRFYVPLKNFSLIWRRHHCRWRAAKFRPMLGAQSLWAGRDLYRATPTATRDFGFSGLIRKTAPLIQLPLTTRMGMRRTYSNPDPHGYIKNRQRKKCMSLKKIYHWVLTKFQLIIDSIVKFHAYIGWYSYAFIPLLLIFM
jgi:hypothetical protein